MDLNDAHVVDNARLGVTIGWDQYRASFFEQMRSQQMHIEALALRVQRGEKITLLCSNACDDPALCHRTLVIELVNDLVSGIDTQKTRT